MFNLHEEDDAMKLPFKCITYKIWDFLKIAQWAGTDLGIKNKALILNLGMRLECYSMRYTLKTIKFGRYNRFLDQSSSQVQIWPN